MAWLHKCMQLETELGRIAELGHLSCMEHWTHCQHLGEEVQCQ